jgi:hypothetical protein
MTQLEVTLLLNSCSPIFVVPLYFQRISFASQAELQQARAQALSEGEASMASRVAELTQQLAEKSGALEEAEQEKEKAKLQLAR